jgi:hypothetical protein
MRTISLEAKEVWGTLLAHYSRGEVFWNSTHLELQDMNLMLML